ncbi:MAG: phenylalanine-4-hydroxylase [Bacteroidota bacterium]
MNQQFKNYNDEDLKVWSTLFERQINNLKDKGSIHYLTALDKMKSVLNKAILPNFEEINDWFKKTSGWEIYCVPGLIPVDEFFILLSQKKFPASTWLRSIDKLDYLEEPDMFHDVFGHIPLLCNPIFSNFVHEFGKLGVLMLDNEQNLLKLQRLYWFTIEFGLIQEEDEIKVFGAGIISSFGETNASLEITTSREKYKLESIIERSFITSEIQSTYFVLPDLNVLLESIIYLTQKWKQHELVN